MAHILVILTSTSNTVNVHVNKTSS